MEDGELRILTRPSPRGRGRKRRARSVTSVGADGRGHAEKDGQPTGHWQRTTTKIENENSF